MTFTVRGMDPSGRYLNVVDVEATCWQGRQPADQVSEIIEIGLCVLDMPERTRAARHRIVVRPSRSTVSEFCTELTGLTQDEVDEGISFPEACAMLARDHLAGSRAWASWGDYDRKQFEKQCAESGAPYPFGAAHTNAKRAFAEAHGLPRKQLGMADALRYAGLPLEGRHHSGEDDAWNIAALILHLMARDRW